MSLIDTSLPDAPLGVMPAGVLIRLDVERVAPARIEVSAASLLLEAEAEEIASKSGALEISSDNATADWTNAKAKEVSWISIDWGARRALTGIHVKVGGASHKVGRLKIGDGGTWYPPPTHDTIALGGLVLLPGVIASRLLIEITQDDVARTPTTESITDFALTFVAGDLSLVIGGRPCWDRAGPVLPGRPSAAAGDAFVAALNAAVPADGAAGSVALSLRAGLTGSVSVKAAFTAARLATSLDPPGAANALALRWAEGATATVTLAPHASLQEIRFRLRLDVAPEDLALSHPAAVVRGNAQLVDPDHAGAQGVPRLIDAAITGVEVFVRPTVAPVAGSVALHPDADGRPAAMPFGGAVVPFTFDAAGEAAWLPCMLDTTLRLEGAFWIVLTVSAGELVWPLADTGPSVDRTPSPGARYRIGDGPWLPRALPKRPAPWAICRVRRAAAPPTAALSVRIGCGPVPTSSSLTLTPDPRGGVEVGMADLAALNEQIAARNKGPAGTSVPLHFAVATVPPAAGTVTLENLRVRYACATPAGLDVKET